FFCEFSSTRTGIPFGWYFYNGSTRGQELYLSNVPFMDSLSFSFLLFTSYCLALVLLLPGRGHWLSLELRENPAIRRSGQVLAFNLAVTFWIDEPVIGTTGLFMYFPITAFLLLKLAGRMPAPAS